MFIQSVDDWAEKVISDPQWAADCLHRLYRFGGQNPESTVCRHSLEVWHMCRHLSIPEQLWALVHDCHEILSGEIAKAWKTRIIQIGQADADSILRDRLGIANVNLLEVHNADLKHGRIERDAITSGVHEYQYSYTIAPAMWCETFEDLRRSS